MIASASTGAQRVLTGTLAELAAGDAEIDPPATLVCGPSVALAGELAWFAPAAAAQNRRSPLPPELAQDVLEDAAVAVVLDLVRGVDPDPAGELLVVGPDGDLAGKGVGPGALKAGDLEGLVPGEAEDSADSPAGSSRGRMPMPTRLARWMRS